jgi:YD repeat-containing protein
MTFLYDAANRITTLLQGGTLTTFTFDNTGNQTEENAAGNRTTYGYDNENRLTSVVLPAGTRSTVSVQGGGASVAA